MADPFIAEIRLLPYTYAPQDWAACDGGYIPIVQNPSLYALIGTYYGGDGVSNMRLPNMQGRIPMHVGGNGTSNAGRGLSTHRLGEAGGQSGVMITQSQIPKHSHLLNVSLDMPSTTDPDKKSFPSKHAGLGKVYKNVPPTAYTQMAEDALAKIGEFEAHENRQPYLTLQFCIALDGVFPPRQ